MTQRDQQGGEIWLDGQWLASHDANVPVLTHSLHYGMAIFEGVRAYTTPSGPALFRLHDHTRRFFESARILGMHPDFTPDELTKVQLAVVRRNHLQDAYIRPLLFYGAQSMSLHSKDLKVRCAVAAWAWGSYLGEDKLRDGVRVKVSSYARMAVNSILSRAKTSGYYVNSMLALREALNCGYDEALLLDSEGYAAEGSGENLFLVRDQVLYTPPTGPALDGITRRTIMQLAAEANYQVIERRLTRDEVYLADEAFFTGTAAEVTPIREVDGHQIGQGGRGPITEKLQTRYFEVVHGKDGQHKDWLSVV